MEEQPEEWVAVMESFDKPETFMAAKKTDVVPDAAKMGDKWAVGALKPKSIDNKPIEFLTQLAKDIAMNLVFTDRHIRPGDDHHIGMIFMPICMGAFADTTPEYRQDVGLMYEYYDKAGPRSMNGYPLFFSFAYCSQHDAKIVWEKVFKIKDALDAI